jgi:hypothetical protein
VAQLTLGSGTIPEPLLVALLDVPDVDEAVEELELAVLEPPVPPVGSFVTSSSQPTPAATARPTANPKKCFDLMLPPVRASRWIPARRRSLTPRPPSQRHPSYNVGAL